MKNIPLTRAQRTWSGIGYGAAAGFGLGMLAVMASMVFGGASFSPSLLFAYDSFIPMATGGVIGALALGAIGGAVGGFYYPPETKRALETLEKEAEREYVVEIGAAVPERTRPAFLDRALQREAQDRATTRG